MNVAVPRLLITDDDANFRETLRFAFEPRGFQTVLAGDGEEALSIIRRERVHLALLDVHMPRLSGLDTLRALRRWDAALPCILLSARLDEMIIEAARQEHAYSVLPKPVSLREITAIVSQALAQAYNWTFQPPR